MKFVVYVYNHETPQGFKVWEIKNGASEQDSKVLPLLPNMFDVETFIYDQAAEVCNLCGGDGVIEISQGDDFYTKPCECRGDLPEEDQRVNDR